MVGRGWLWTAALLGLGGCDGETANRIEIALSFRATVSGTTARCGESYAQLGDGSFDIQLADARLFVSSIELHHSAGSWVPLELHPSEWQHDGVALLDFEDATFACEDSGTPETNTTVTGSLPEAVYDAVRFRVGVPFELNHLDGATAAAPLDVPGMYWTWQRGYKFLRADFLVRRGNGEAARWNVHIGSTACASPAPTRAPTEPCSRPNMAEVYLGQLDPTRDVVGIDLGALVASTAFRNTPNSAPGCMSDPVEVDDCEPIFAALGLRFDEGECVSACLQQTVFSAER